MLRLGGNPDRQRERVVAAFEKQKTTAEISEILKTLYHGGNAIPLAELAAAAAVEASAAWATIGTPKQNRVTTKKETSCTATAFLVFVTLFRCV